MSDDVWTQGTTIAARNAAQCKALLEGTPCDLHRGDDWEKDKTRCPFCDRNRGDYRASPFTDGPNARAVASTEVT